MYNMLSLRYLASLLIEAKPKIYHLSFFSTIREAKYYVGESYFRLSTTLLLFLIR